MSTVSKLTDRKLIHPPNWLPTNVQYECIMGSVAYGVSSDTSDMDVYGICIPPKHMVFPHLAGEIEGFGRQKKRFEQFQQHHVLDESSGKQYDITIYNIVKFFTLAMENNPNIVDALFVPDNCVLHTTQVGTLIRENRKIFLNKNAWHTFKGYAYAQAKKIRDHKIPKDNPVIVFEQKHNISNLTTYDEVVKEFDYRRGVSDNLAADDLVDLDDDQIQEYAVLYREELKKSKRFEMIKVHSYDLKFAYHIYRLMDEVEQILTKGDIDLQRASGKMKEIRNGYWTEDRVFEHFRQQESVLEEVYAKSTLPYSPREEDIKKLLCEALEIHYGSISEAIKVDVNVEKILLEIEERLAIIRSTL